jgi:hypothetical protein
MPASSGCGPPGVCSRCYGNFTARGPGGDADRTRGKLPIAGTQTWGLRAARRLLGDRGMVDGMWIGELKAAVCDTAI